MNRVIDWVSPLRPEATDIAEYTERVRDALRGQFALNAIGPNMAGELSRYRQDFIPLFNIGNDVRFHGAILDACMAISGAVVAHDYRVQDLILGWLKARYMEWHDPYLELMRRHYGEEGYRAALAFTRGDRTLATLADDFPGIEIVAENALCIVTHNPALADDLARRTGLYCAALPLPFPVAENFPLVQKPVKDKTELLVFGYLGQNRGLDIAFKLLRQRPNLRLHVAGQVGNDDLSDSLRAMRQGGFDIVEHGFLEERALDEMIHRSDLVLNLRHPTMGEVSGSQLRIFANRGLSVVCRTGWYANLPDDAVFKIDPRRTLEELLAIVDELPRNADKFAAMRANGHVYVRRHHSLNRFASSFRDFMSVSDEALRHGRSVLLARHIGDMYMRAHAGPAVDGGTLFDKARDMLGAA